MNPDATPFDRLGGEPGVRTLVDRVYDLMDLEPAYAGIRPKLVGPGDAAADFVIDDSAVHGVPGLVNLLGIESPGLTSSLAIAEHVASLLPGRA